MGKIHYTNRKIEGLKLGQVVNKDLLKRIPPHASSKAAFRDPSIDLDVSGKSLTDDGLLEIASALVEALTYDGNQGRSSRLEELCLKDNGLTATSLQALTPIIKLACNDLRDLDLSGNRIQIDTADEVTIWERFLTSFEQCCTLRRIDFSGNVLGPRGFEVLFRVYAKENPIDLMLPSELEQWQDELEGGSTDNTSLSLRKMSLISEPEEHGGGLPGDPSTSRRKGSRHDSKSPEKPGVAVARADPVPLFATTQGLRSVPYLVLCDTAMTETCALHLSFVLEGHHMPRQLLTRVPPAKAASQTQQITNYDESRCRGIIYHPNTLLGNAGLKVLELAERRRTQQHCNTSEAEIEPPSSPSESSKSLRRTYGATLVSGDITIAKQRRSTQRGALDHGEVGAELDRARSRIQGNTLHDAGPHSNDLWGATLRLLAKGRHVAYQSDRIPKRLSLVPAGPKIRSPIVRTLTVPGLSKPKTLKPLTPLTVEKDPNQPMNPWNTSFRKQIDAVPPTPNVTPPTPLSPKTETENPKVAAEITSLPRIDKVYRTKLPRGFPEYAWAKITGHIVGAEGILSDDQQLSVLRYAIDRSTLSKEREALGLTSATQIWRILEATGCLAYEMDF